MHKQPINYTDASGLRIGIVVSRYHQEITDSLCEAAKAAFLQAGGRAHDLHVVPAPGTFELTAICRALAYLPTRTGRRALDGLVALGCVISGETTHDQHIAQAVAQGLTDITVETGMPIAFGVLTCQTIDQARARSVKSKDAAGFNKGAEAMQAVIESAGTIKIIESSRGIR